MTSSIQLPTGFGINQNQSTYRNFNLMQASQEFIQAHPNTFFSTTLSSIVTYDNGIYRKVEKNELNSFILNFLLQSGYKYSKTSQVDAIRNTIEMMDNFKNDVIFDENPFVFAVKNCVIDVSNGEVKIKKFSPEIYLSTRYDVEYDSNAVASNFTKALSEILPDNREQYYLLQWMAYSLTKDASFQKMLIQSGKGRNGKDLIWSTLKAIVGTNNYSTLTSEMITKDKHMKGHLENKNFNLSSEERKELIMEVYKELTGGNLITCNPKFKDAHTFMNTAKYILNMNELPRLSEFSTSVRNRLVVLNFKQTFTDDIMDTGLSRKITTETEKSGLLNILIGVIPSIFNGGYIKFDAPESVKDSTRESLNEMSGIGGFIDEHLKKTDNYKDVILVSELYDVYSKYCAENNIQKLSKIKLNKLISNVLDLQIFAGNHNKSMFRFLTLSKGLVS